jgi:hypothetical protein
MNVDIGALKLQFDLEPSYVYWTINELKIFVFKLGRYTDVYG